MTPAGKTFDPETVTDKQLVQYEQAIAKIAIRGGDFARFLDQ